MRGDELADRFVKFGVAVLGLIETLPKTPTGRHVGEQLLRSGTSCGANYEEGRGAESREDFIHKLGITHKELKECRYWLKLIGHGGLVKNGASAGVLQECEELCAIVGRSIKTARGK